MAQDRDPGGKGDECETSTNVVGNLAQSHIATGPDGNSACRTDASLPAVGNQDEAPVLHLDGSTAPDDPIFLGRKRKSSPATGSHPDRINKRLRLVGGNTGQGSFAPVATVSSLCLDRSLLPPEIWHLVFTYCPPKSLGNLLSVNRLFNLYLDPSSPARKYEVPRALQCALSPMEPNAIWQASRRLFWPQMPAPLRSKTELDMWRITCSPICQDCGKQDVKGRVSPPDPGHPGPGTDSVASIWAFGRRMCAFCLLKASEKELDLQISPSIPSAIIPALPFVFLTQDRDVFSATAVELGQLPTNLQVTKLFPKSDVKALQEEFLQVKDMGAGTVGEWLKGLPGRGSTLRHDASKWEKWESSGGAWKMRSLLCPRYEGKPPNSLPRKPPTPLGPFFTPERHERTADAAEPQSEAKYILGSEGNSEPSFAIERREDGHLGATPATVKETRDQNDKNWEEAQAPLRVKIAGYADEAVRDNLKKGRKLSRDTCSRFAVDSLIHVRKRFYAGVAKDAEAARAAGQPPTVDPPGGPFTQKLTLENMKWIFDTKIKPHTETLRKELFYCNGCEGNFKPFGFEGVIQHYAAKHTSALSLGNIVVHWRAEWPKHPPFSAAARKALPHPHGPDTFPGSVGTLLPANYHFAPSAALPTQPPPVYPPPVGYGYTPPAYINYAQSPPPYQPQPAIPPPFVSQPVYEHSPSYIAPPAAYTTYQPPTAPYFAPEIDMAQGWKPPQAVQYGYHYASQESSGGSPYTMHQASAYPDLHQSKVEDIARNSREVWKLLSDIRDLPGSLKVLATIHHLVQRFRSRFYETPPLSLFIDGLSNNKEMRPVRNINGLVCKACRLGLGNATSVEKDRKEFSLPQLANHFQSRHIEQMGCGQGGHAALDWVLDMVFVSDLEMSTSASLPASEPQRALLSAALPTAVAQAPATASGQPGPPSQARQPGSVSGAGQNLPAANARGEFQGIPGHGFPGESSHSSLVPSGDDDRSALGNGARQSSQGSNPNRGQGGVRAHKKPAGQGKRSKLHNRGGRGAKPLGKKPNIGHGNQKHVKGGNSHRLPATKTQASTQPNSQPLPGQGKETTLSSSANLKQEEFNVMGALDSYLRQNEAPQLQGQQGAAKAPSSGEAGGPVEHAHSRPPRPEGYARHGDSEDSTQASCTAINRRDPASRRPSGAAAGRKLDDVHDPRRIQPGLADPHPRLLEGERFGAPAPHTEARNHLAAPPEAGYSGYQSERRLQSRPSVETYEIVHVIDDSGEYYIRRPVRRAADSRHKYEDRGVPRGAAPYPAFEPSYGSLSRSNLAQEGIGATVVPENRPAGPWPGRRPGPTFYEEYDPRFPGA